MRGIIQWWNLRLKKILVGRCYQDGDTGHSWLQPPSQENQLATVDKILLWKSQNPGVRLKHPLYHRDWEGPHRRVGGVATLWLIAPSPGWHSPPQEDLSGPTLSPVGKREPKVDLQLHQCCRTLSRKHTRFLPHRDHWGNVWGLNSGNQVETEKEAGLTESSTQMSADQIPALSGTEHRS